MILVNPHSPTIAYGLMSSRLASSVCVVIAKQNAGARAVRCHYYCWIEPCPDSLVVRSAVPSDITQITPLFGQLTPCQSSSDVEALIAPSSKRCLVASSASGHLVGAALFSVLKTRALQSFLPLGQAELLAHELNFLSNYPALGLLEKLAVLRDDYESYAAERLVEAGVSWLVHETPISTMLCFARSDGHLCPLASCLERASFTSTVEIEQFWHKASCAGDYLCPACEAPCYCSAVVFIYDK